MIRELWFAMVIPKSIHVMWGAQTEKVEQQRYAKGCSSIGSRVFLAMVLSLEVDDSMHFDAEMCIANPWAMVCHGGFSLFQLEDRNDQINPNQSKTCKILVFPSLSHNQI